MAPPSPLPETFKHNGETAMCQLKNQHEGVHNEELGTNQQFTYPSFTICEHDASREDDICIINNQEQLIHILAIQNACATVGTDQVEYLVIN
jgi:hypothetical protein